LYRQSIAAIADDIDGNGQTASSSFLLDREPGGMTVKPTSS